MGNGIKKLGGKVIISMAVGTWRMLITLADQVLMSFATEVHCLVAVAKTWMIADRYSKYIRDDHLVSMKRY
jgi:hypothetical protein